MPITHNTLSALRYKPDHVFVHNHYLTSTRVILGFVLKPFVLESVYVLDNSTFLNYWNEVNLKRRAVG